MRQHEVMAAANATAARSRLCPAGPNGCVRRGTRALSPGPGSGHRDPLAMAAPVGRRVPGVRTPTPRREPMGGQAFPHALERLPEWPLQKDTMVWLAVMMRDAVLRVSDRDLTDTLQAAFDHGQHRLGVICVELRPFAIPARHVDRRGVGEHAALPAVMMASGVEVLRAAPAGRHPAVPVGPHLPPEV